MAEPKAGFYWHVHHEALLEWCFDYEERADYIRRMKAPDEVGTRLRLLRVVRGGLPPAVLKAGAALHRERQICDEARRVYEKTREALEQQERILVHTNGRLVQEAYYEAREAYHRASESYEKSMYSCDRKWLALYEDLRANLPAIEALHKRECPDCPWNGKTIFPKRAE